MIDPTPYGEPIKTTEELAALDQADILDGYSDGLDNAPEPSGNRSKGYWHGWRNGMIDRGLLPVHPNGLALIKSLRAARETESEGQ